ncbi:MAG: hypothetical protein IJQ28_01410, partial [Clostridia bacterium]|nr:hypothetical protein [Clostridia bacterium]
SQMNKGYFLQFNRDNSFKLAYSPKDDPTAEKSELNDNVEIYIEHSGTWEEKGDEIILKYTDGSGDDGFTLKKDKDIIYNPELIFKGKVYNEDVFQGTYETENKDGKYDSIVFFDDGNVTYDTHWGKTVRNRQGYYKRNGNIITIRYNNDADTEHKFLVTADGIVEDIYMTN